MKNLNGYEFNDMKPRTSQTVLQLAALMNENQPSFEQIKLIGVNAFGSCGFSMQLTKDGTQWKSIEPNRVPITILYRTIDSQVETMVYMDRGFLGFIGGYPDDYVDELVEQMIVTMKYMFTA